MLRLWARRRLLGLSLSVTIASVGLVAGAPAAAATGSQTLVIGVDQADPANQVDHGFGTLTPGRWFEYTDFFTRNVRIHTGDTLTFRTAARAFHVIALAGNEAAARAKYPVVSNDTDDPDLAPGSGAPKLEFGPGNFVINGGDSVKGGGVDFNAMFPSCGITGPPPFGSPACTFSGGTDVESAGGLPGIDLFASDFTTMPPTIVPGPLDWSIQVNASPGSYAYFCFIHPGMRGKLTVVGANRPTTTQAQIDSLSKIQLKQDQRAALKAEAEANEDSGVNDENGIRTHVIKVGISAANNHVAIDEMLPARPLNVKVADRIVYLWPDRHNVHTVSFPSWSPTFTGPFVPDCSPSDPVIAPPPGTPPGAPPVCGEPGSPFPEFIADPGTARPGHLTDPTTVVDSGVLIGTDYGVTPSVQDWSAIADASATYHFQCQIHDWMLGTVNAGAAAAEGDRHASPRSSTQHYSAGIARWMQLRQSTH